MSIVSSQYDRDGQHIVERHTDHLGRTFTQTWFAQSDWTTAQIDAKVAEHAAQIELSLAESEADEVLQG